MINSSLERTQARLAVARGDQKADLLLVNARLVNILSGQIELTAVAITDGIMVGIGDYEAVRTIDLGGAYLVPGFIESHIHIESSKLTPARFAEVVIQHGTTTVIADPHEIANVLGIRGIQFMIEDAENVDPDLFFMLPSCVPATHMETSGAILNASDLAPLLASPKVLGIGEMMNYPGTFLGAEAVLSKLELAQSKLPIDGHAPGLTGKLLNAYILAGPATDHECTTLEEAQEKLSRGMKIQIRQGSTAHNLHALRPLITPENERRLMFATDDRRPGDLLHQGHLDYTLRLAVEEGVNPIIALRMVTLNPAETYGLHDRGVIKPGARADLVVLNNLEEFKVLRVWKDGVEVFPNSEPESNRPGKTIADDLVRFSIPSISQQELIVPDHHQPVRVIGIVSNQIVTENLSLHLPAANGVLSCDRAQDVAKIIVIDRYTGTGKKTIGFVKGLGLENGALGSTVAHDSHNLIVAGDNDESMLTAIAHLSKTGGGQIVVSGTRVLAELPLPVAGLMSDQPATEVALREDQLLEQAKAIGCKLNDPFMALSFLALPVIPALKITDQGLVDVDQFKIVSLYIQNA